MAEELISDIMGSGHKEVIGETIAKLKLFYEGFNVYSRFLDVDAVDFIIRERKKKKVFYKEIQMKYSKYYSKHKYYWFGVSKSSFEHRDNHFFMFICGNMNKIFIVPSKKMHTFLKKFNSDGKKWHVIIRERKNIWYFATKGNHEHINISEFLNDFKRLK